MSTDSGPSTDALGVREVDAVNVSPARWTPVPPNRTVHFSSVPSLRRGRLEVILRSGSITPGGWDSHATSRFDGPDPLKGAEWTPSPETPDEEYSMYLTTGRSGY
jgi:hypothetical protein